MKGKVVFILVLSLIMLSASAFADGKSLFQVVSDSLEEELTPQGPTIPNEVDTFRTAKTRIQNWSGDSAKALSLRGKDKAVNKRRGIPSDISL